MYCKNFLLFFLFISQASAALSSELFKRGQTLFGQDCLSAHATKSASAGDLQEIADKANAFSAFYDDYIEFFQNPEVRAKFSSVNLISKEKILGQLNEILNLNYNDAFIAFLYKRNYSISCRIDYYKSYWTLKNCGQEMMQKRVPISKECMIRDVDLFRAKLEILTLELCSYSLKILYEKISPDLKKLFDSLHNHVPKLKKFFQTGELELPDDNFQDCCNRNDLNSLRAFNNMKKILIADYMKICENVCYDLKMPEAPAKEVTRVEDQEEVASAEPKSASKKKKKGKGKKKRPVRSAASSSQQASKESEEEEETKMPGKQGQAVGISLEQALPIGFSQDEEPVIDQAEQAVPEEAIAQKYVYNAEVEMQNRRRADTEGGSEVSASAGPVMGKTLHGRERSIISEFWNVGVSSMRYERFKTLLGIFGFEKTQFRKGSHIKHQIQSTSFREYKRNGFKIHVVEPHPHNEVGPRQLAMYRKKFREMGIDE